MNGYITRRASAYEYAINGLNKIMTIEDPEEDTCVMITFTIANHPTINEIYVSGSSIGPACYKKRSNGEEEIISVSEIRNIINYIKTLDVVSINMCLLVGTTAHDEEFDIRHHKMFRPKSKLFPCVLYGWIMDAENTIVRRNLRRAAKAIKEMKEQ